MIFPWMFDEMHALRPFKEVAQLLAEKKDWPPLYDIASLNNNKVRVLFITADDSLCHQCLSFFSIAAANIFFGICLCFTISFHLDSSPTITIHDPYDLHKIWPSLNTWAVVD